jgi:hypothetical protein
MAFWPAEREALAAADTSSWEEGGGRGEGAGMWVCKQLLIQPCFLHFPPQAPLSLLPPAAPSQRPAARS